MNRTLKLLIANTIIVSAVWVGLIYLYVQPKFDAVDMAINDRPPVAVVDFISLALAHGGKPQELDQFMVKGVEAVERLRLAGYLVISGSSVLAAPEAIKVTEDMIEGSVNEADK